MSISNDYLDETSAISCEFLAPVKTIFENDALLKVVRVYAEYHTTGTSLHHSTEVFQKQNPMTFDETVSDLEIFNLFKTYVLLPANPADEDEIGLTQDELIKQRDPEGIHKMPLDSPEVQAMIAEFRDELSQEIKLGPMGRVKEVYQEVMKSVKETTPVSLDHLDITVIYVKKSDLSTDLTFTKSVSLQSLPT